MRPLVPEDYPDRLHAQSMRSLTRAAIALSHRALGDDRNAARRVEGDRAAEMIVKAATSPTTLTNTSALAAVAQAFLAALVPASAAADLFSRALSVSFNGAARIQLPSMSSGVATFIAESKPAPVIAFQTSTGPVITPSKLLMLATATQELLQSTNAEAVIRAMLVTSAAQGLDKVLFDNQPADGIRPAGLRFGVSALTAAGAGADAMLTDALALSNVVGKVADQIVFVAGVPQANALRMRGTRPFPYPVLLSSQIPDGMVIAVAANALAAAFGEPQLEASREAVMQREDTAPVDIVDGSGVVAHPVMSVYQVDAVAIKIRQTASWAVRDPHGVAWMASVNW